MNLKSVIVPKEALCLETCEIPLRYIWASRRLMFLRTIPKRNDNELTRLVYEAQKKEPLRRDFIKLIEENAQLIIYVIDEEKIRNISKYEPPKEINQKIRTAAFKHLQTLQVSQSKLKNIKFYTLKLQ